MTDKEKLNKLFQAALQDSSEPGKPPTRVFPTSPAAAAPVPPQEPAPAPIPVAAAPPEPAPDLVRPMENAGLDEAASKELGLLLDEQMERKKRGRRRELLVTLGVCLALAGGGYGWFVQSPQRVQAFQEAMRDLRASGDVSSMVAKYRQALDRVAVRSQQIDQATAAMGVKGGAGDEKDPYMEEEMRAMMGGEKGKTVGQRNKMLQDNFGHMEAKEGKARADGAVKTNETNSFDWKK
ncbi:hypothetical protein JIN84_09505 [Luteolibacter yonseiensis]|uniref:Uncharacterized protein n=1 Tax=Luteolibacter yonseiensis TaxID=1144680 RepID=A0A934QZZ0_9BACT|nr:hypothetical protein [Luteolibacter yonseiensis]MBK1815853.1 hypothetical protein [Luteolibacter yonseiensis]